MLHRFNTSHCLNFILLTVLHTRSVPRDSFNTSTFFLCRHHFKEALCHLSQVHLLNILVLPEFDHSDQSVSMSGPFCKAGHVQSQIFNSKPLQQMTTFFKVTICNGTANIVCVGFVRSPQKWRLLVFLTSSTVEAYAPVSPFPSQSEHRRPQYFQLLETTNQSHLVRFYVLFHFSLLFIIIQLHDTLFFYMSRCCS